jgi:hypothetical protein
MLPRCTACCNAVRHAATLHGMLPRCTACCHVARHVATLFGMLQRCSACCHVVRHAATLHGMLPRCTACCHVARHAATLYGLLQARTHPSLRANLRRRRSACPPVQSCTRPAQARGRTPTRSDAHICACASKPAIVRARAQTAPLRTSRPSGPRAPGGAAAAAAPSRCCLWREGHGVRGRSRSGADVWTVYIGKQRTRVKVHCARPKREGPGLSGKGPGLSGKGPGLSGKGPGLSGKGLGRSGRSEACLCVERAVDARHVCEHLPQRPEAALRPARLSVPVFR